MKLRKKSTYHIAIILALLCLAVYIIPHLINNNTETINSNEQHSEIPVESLLNKMNFTGELQEIQKINNEYYNALYKENGQYNNHIINIKKKKEFAIEKLCKNDNEFINKITVLMKKDMPDTIVDDLIKSTIVYSFNENYLELMFYDYAFTSNKEFNFKIDYNDIIDILNFNIIPKKPIINEQSLDKNKVSIAFTFDDGPNGDKTIRLIDALEDYNMSATFFVVGKKINKNVESLKYVANSHSEIGYHSYKHEYFTKQTKNEIKNDFKVTDDILYKNTEKHFLLTRPPYGSYNNDVLNSLNQVFVRWDIDTNDWRYKDVDYLFNYVLENYKDGDIILFHDSYETSVDAAIKLIDELYKRDVQVLSVSKLAEVKGIELQNHKVYTRIR